MSSQKTLQGFHVVLVGRPNVGKSALFNRLANSRRALVHDRPGMTRDSLAVDTTTGSGRPYTLVDTGGLDLDATEGFAAWTSERSMAAIADADLLLFVLDGVDGLLPEDQRIGAKLHALGKPVAAVWNKADTRRAQESVAEAHMLGFDDVIAVSALHAIGITELDEVIERHVPQNLDPETREEPLAIAIIGRPNVGKSTLVNALLGKDRVMVSAIAGTTRDSIDVPFEVDGRKYLLVDTAGIRRKGKTTDPAEILSVISARKTLERAKIAILVFDAGEGITSQDAHIAGYAEESGCGMLLVANKWDLLGGDLERETNLTLEVRRRFAWVKASPYLPMTAIKGRGVKRLMTEADAIAKRYLTRFSTGELNRLLQKAFQEQTPRDRKGHDMKIRYAVQVASGPPLIRLFADRTEPLHFSFERFIENRIRERWPMDGVPIRFVVKADASRRTGKDAARPPQRNAKSGEPIPESPKEADRSAAARAAAQKAKGRPGAAPARTHKPRGRAGRPARKGTLRKG